MKTLFIQDLLLMCGLPRNARVKLANHLDPSCVDFDLATLEHQPRGPVFACDYVVGFLRLDRGLSRFEGVYAVGPYDTSDSRYVLIPMLGFEALEGIIVDWSARQWLQGFDQMKPIVQERIEKKSRAA